MPAKRAERAVASSRRMRILHVISSLDAISGGPAVALAGLAGAQQRQGLGVSIVATWRDGEDRSAADMLGRQGVIVESIGPTVGALQRHPLLDAALRRHILDADIVHIHALWEQAQHRAARLAPPKPYLIRPCGMLDPWSLRQSRLKKRVYMALRLRRNLQHAAALHFTTDIERDLTTPLHLRPRAIVEPNGVDLGEFAALPAPGTFRAKYPQTIGRRLLVFMSRLHHKKGLDKLIPAFAALKDRHAMLALVGPDSGGYRATVEQMIAQAGMADRVFFTGMLRGADRVAALADSDLFVLPSYQENFGVSVVEALAAGTPVVVSDQVNIYPDVLAGKVGGVTPMDSGLLTKEIDRWLADENLLKSTRPLAAAFARERYDWNSIARRWVGHYEELTSSKEKQ